jgi:hypothetical protein
MMAHGNSRRTLKVVDNPCTDGGMKRAGKLLRTSAVDKPVFLPQIIHCRRTGGSPLLDTFVKSAVPRKQWPELTYPQIWRSPVTIAFTIF